jgi:prevent-host-death family protein
MSTHVSVAQAKAEFAALVSRAEAGEEIIVTRNGRPVARLTHLESLPVVYGDLIGLMVADDLSLPADVIASFEPAL